MSFAAKVSTAVFLAFLHSAMMAAMLTAVSSNLILPFCREVSRLFPRQGIVLGPPGRLLDESRQVRGKLDAVPLRIDDGDERPARSTP